MNPVTNIKPEPLPTLNLNPVTNLNKPELLQTLTLNPVTYIELEVTNIKP